MQDINLNLRCPFAKNFIQAILFFFLFLFFTLLAFWIPTTSPQTFAEKCFTLLAFAIASAGAVFLLFAFYNSIRNCIEVNVSVTKETLKIQRKQEIPLQDILRAERTEKEVIFFLQNGQEVHIRRNQINIPLQTLIIAIEQRKGQPL